MEKALKHHLKTGLIVLAGLAASGCAEFYRDSPLGEIEKAREQIKAEARSEWKGTAVIRRDIYPNGTVVFVIDHNKLPRQYKQTLGYIAYTDAFIDEENYEGAQIGDLEGRTYSITYVPLNNSNASRNVGQTNRRPNLHLFACNYFLDLPPENLANYPNDFVGIKNSFRDDENLILVAYDSDSKKGQKLSLKLYNPKGNVIYERDRTLYHDGNSARFGEWQNLADLCVTNGGHGSYRVVWSLDGEYYGSTEFEIVPSSKK